MHERIADRPFRRLSKFCSRNEQGMDVHPVGIEGEVSRRHLLVIDGHEHQIDVGLGPHLVVRQATTKDRRQDRSVLLHLLDEGTERLLEPLFDRPLLHAAPPRP